MIVFGLHSYLNEHFKWHSCRLGTIAIPWFQVHNFSSFANVFKYYIRLESKRKTGDVSETFSKQKELLCSGWVPCFVFSCLMLWDLVFRPFLLCFWQVFARLEKKTDISLPVSLPFWYQFQDSLQLLFHKSDWFVQMVNAFAKPLKVTSPSRA